MCDPQGVGHALSPGHPDAALITQARAALSRWAATAPGSPTSSVLGGGAISEAEYQFGVLHDGRPALLLPSASYALHVGLRALGVGRGDEVICSIIDWPAGFAAIAALGAVPVPVPVSPATLTLDPAAASKARTDRTRAILACHLFGVCADVGALRSQLPDVPILEDAAQAFGSTLDGKLAGTMGEAAVLSLGPGKQIDAGEGGVLLLATGQLHDRATGYACHPLRQLLAGLGPPAPAALTIRPHPMTAIIAVHELAAWAPQHAQAARLAALRRLAGARHVQPLGTDARRTAAQPFVPVLARVGGPAGPPAGIRWARAGAQVLPSPSAAHSRAARALLGRVRLAVCIEPDSPGASKSPDQTRSRVL
jgi:hypothetical protein